VLRLIGQRLAASPADTLVFGEAERATIAALLDSPRLDCQQPVLIHGDFGPQAVRCTAGENVHLEAIIDPGFWVGGDGLYDLACGMSAAHPAAWREGLLDGYQSIAPLTPDEQRRLPALRLLASYWGACRRYIRAEPHEEYRAEALRLIGELAPRIADCKL
jgi:Ser/Thr protein kinase RdoA (MazF antagonist)